MLLESVSIHLLAIQRAAPGDGAHDVVGSSDEGANSHVFDALTVSTAEGRSLESSGSAAGATVEEGVGVRAAAGAVEVESWAWENGCEEA